MVPKITVGAGLRGALEYDQSKINGEPRAEWIAGTLIGTPGEMAAQARHFRALRPDCKKPVWRCSISLPPSDGRQTLQKWESIATDFLRKMAIPQNAAWCAIRHFDRDHDHIHLTVLRTLPDGTLWNQEHSARRAIKACEQLELMHNLATHSRSPASKDRPLRAEIEISQRKGTPMTREKIQDSVNQILANHPVGIDFAELQKRLATEGIDVQPYAPGGVMKGVSYFCDGFKWPGSRIGREYSAGLTERGVRYSAVGADNAHARERAVVKPKPDQTLHYAPVPALRPAPPSPATRSPMDMERFTRHVSGLDIGPLSKAMLLLGGASISLSIEALLVLINFIKKILARLGVKLRYPTPTERVGEPYFVNQRAVTWDSVAKDIVPAPLPTELPSQASIDAAAKKIIETAAAIQSGRPEMLPDVGDDAARGTLVSTLSQAAAPMAPLALLPAAPSLDDIFDGPEIPAGPVAAASAAVSPGQPQKWLESKEQEPLQAQFKTLERLAAAHRNAFMAHQSSASRVSTNELERLKNLSRQAQQKVLGQLDQVRQMVNQRADPATRYAPTRDAAKRLLGALGPLRGRLHLFIAFPSRERFTEALEPFKKEEKRFKDFLKMHPVPVVVPVDDEAKKAQDAPMPGPFEVPRG